MLRTTVLMAVRDGLPHLLPAVRSILSQSQTSFELLVVDDGSTDGGPEAIEALEDRRIRILRRPPRGQGAALNDGLEVVQTEFVARMDADDVALPNRLAAQERFLSEHRDVGVLGTRFAFTIDGIRAGPAPPMPRSHERIEAVLSRGGHALCHPTLMVRTDVIRSIGGYRIAGVGQDTDLFLRLVETTRAANLDDVHLLYRLREDSSAWSSPLATVVGKKYALHAAKRRREGLPAPDPEEFEAAWLDAPLNRLQARVEAASESYYRRAMTRSMKGDRARAVAYALAAAVTNPKKVALRVRRTLFR